MAVVPERVKSFCKEAEDIVELVPYQQWGHKLEEYPGSMRNGVTFLQDMKGRLSKGLERAVAQQQWGKLVIAFYGETNAGKSTLIEAICSWFEEQGQGIRKGTAVGSSIGDGRSDFTRDTTAYECQLQGQAFTLLDVPGIEGQEAAVQAEIDRAIAQAHLVFYVTSDSTPPQTAGGDKTRDGRHEDIEGTLEKIRKHLREEAQVYRIFNKRVTSPRILRDGLKVSAEEKETLVASDVHMRQALGGAYRGHIVLAALPAFFAVAGNLHQDHKLARKQKKFLEDIQVSSLWQLSGVGKFFDKLRLEILPESQHLIEVMNMGKLVKVVQKEVDGPLKRDMDKHLHRLSETKKLLQDAIKEYGLLPREIAQDYRRVSTGLEEHFINGVRSRMEKHHENGLWVKLDGQVQKILEDEVEAELKELVQHVKIECKKFSDRSRVRIQEAGDRLRYILERDQDSSMKDFHFETEESWKQVSIETKHGIDIQGVGAAIVGVVVSALLGPVGWTGVAVTAAASTIFAGRKLLYSGYQREQQRTAIEKALNSIRSRLREKIKEAVQQVGKPIARCAVSKQKDYEEIEKNLDIILNSMRVTRINVERFLKQ